MSFDSRERSLAGGRPVRLYEFSRGTLAWRYGSADRALVFNGRTYAAVAIADDGVRLSGEASADAFKVTMPATLAVAQLYRAAPPTADVFLTVRDYHHGEADVPGSARVVWVGTVSDVRWPAADRAEITCQSLASTMSRTGLRLTWERACPHTIYDRNCRVDRSLYAVATAVQALDGARVGAAVFETFADGYFSGGLVEWSIGGGEVERRGVESHAGGNLVLLGGTAGMAVGLAIQAYPGCRQTDIYCDGQFGNVLNYGGFTHLPGKSPFDGNPIF